jgi:CO/xanthine dehydrogenase FAD-binding subunit
LSLADIREVLRPSSPEEAVEMAARFGSEGAFLAGGTDLLLFCPPRLRVLIDLRDAGLSYIREDGGAIRIGGMTAIQELADSPLLKSHAGGILAETASRCARRPIRNAATIGGSLAGALFYADLPLPLMVLNAGLRLLGSGEREVPAGDFFLGARSTVLKGELLAEVVLPWPEPGSGAFEKLGRTRRDMALASAAALVHIESGLCRRVRLAVGGAVAFPLRFPSAEARLEGRSPDPEAIGEAAGEVAASLVPIRDFRAGADYRREMARVLTARALSSAVERGRTP